MMYLVPGMLLQKQSLGKCVAQYFLSTGRKIARKISVPTLILYEIHHKSFHARVHGDLGLHPASFPIRVSCIIGV